MTDTDPRLIILAPQDNVAVLAATLEKGETIVLAGCPIEVLQRLGMGHKLACQPIPAGADILKYGMPIGFATTDIPLGAHVHVHNLTSRYTAIEVME
ncbi:SAF domain-containing protein [Hoeflea sp. IMCC20628]|uniref:UxaA family hydrolase n=1 Tax=Hoeflea sp. IMCC20628 TaxID=1620421 RepID=UPI00063A96DE|nr:UxaA family hydrolase [Hoeflea sp. IMCC20628]AKH99672.1 SAF domain-containing protein [Hoeflea sp. IMCC20628]